MAATLRETEQRFRRLPITEENRGVFEALLGLPYDLYRPIMDMLLDGTIVVEDLLPQGGTAAGSPGQGRMGALAEDSSRAAAALARHSADVDGPALARRVEELLAGGRPGALAFPRDSSPLAAGPDGKPGPAYAPPGVAVVGSDSTAIVPDPIQSARASSEAQAQKNAQAEFLAAASRGTE